MTQVYAAGGFVLAVIGAWFTWVTIRRAAAKDRADEVRARKQEIDDAVAAAVAVCNAEHGRIEGGLRDTLARQEREAAAVLAAMTGQMTYYRGRCDSLQDRLDGILARIAPGLPPPPR